VVTAAIQLATEAADALRTLALASHRAGNTAGKEAYWAAAELIDTKFNIKGEPA